MERQVRLGVIGAGRIGRLHISNLSTRVAGAKVTAAADIAEGQARELAAKYGIGFVTDDPEKLLSRDDVDAVLICSSTDTHAELIVRAARAGKQIFCEKPISLELRETDRALEAAAKAGVKLQLGFNRRFDPNHARVHAAVERGELGVLHSVRITSRDPAPPPAEYAKVSGGIFLDMTIHDFDMARFLTGAEPEEVYAIGQVLIDPAIGQMGDFDSALTVLRYASGVTVTIDNSRRAVYGYDQRIEAFGSGGMAVSDNVRTNSARIYTGRAVYEDLPPYFFLERYTESFVREMEAFVSAVRDGAPVPVTGEDARAALVLGLTAKRSASEGRPVKLREIG
jgi:myo-inositol 2-dehydrogenase/D-chiro-inositol 1-dehydrogenase